MNSRRSFIKTLSLSVAAISSANILVPTLADSFKWKRTGQWLVVPNPEYVDAPLEMSVIWNHAVMTEKFIKEWGWDKIPKGFQPADPIDDHVHPTRRATVYPYRYDTTGTRLIPPFIKKFVTEPVYSL